jgi:hypothetical protein
VYETIEEEMLNAGSSSAHSVVSKKSIPMTRHPVFIVDSSDTISVHSKFEECATTTTWDDEHGITALRKYYALRDEAENVVDESKRTWLDSPDPFSLFALQSTCVVVSFFVFPFVVILTNNHLFIIPFKATIYYLLISVLVVSGLHRGHHLILKLKVEFRR